MAWCQAFPKDICGIILEKIFFLLDFSLTFVYIVSWIMFFAASGNRIPSSLHCFSAKGDENRPSLKKLFATRDEKPAHGAIVSSCFAGRFSAS